MTKEIAQVNQMGFMVPTINQQLAEDIEGMQLSFDDVKVPAGGGTIWEIPGEEPKKELVGVIVDHFPVNVLWSEVMGESPLCIAWDGKHGVGDPGGKCSTCPNNQFGSAGRGKKCKNKRHIYLLREGSMLPVRLVLSAGSLKNFDAYVVRRLFARGLATFQVVTKITLEKVQNADGQVYSRAVFDVVKQLDQETAQKMAEYAQTIKQMTRRQVEVTAEADELKVEEVPF